jgi:AcrR family transcriptional regulator
LFAEQGFAATTVPQITARAGLTTRTFFRHFADKREVIFGGEEIPALATRLIADAPPDLEPTAVIVEGLRTVAETRFEGRREEVRLNREMIRSDPGLGERDLRKRADLVAAIRDGFVGRGVAATTAVLLAESTVTVIYVALEEWLDQDSGPDGGSGGEVRPLYEIMLGTLDSLQGALGLAR